MRLPYRLLNLYIAIVGMLAGLRLLGFTVYRLNLLSDFNAQYVALSLVSAGILVVMAVVTVLLLVDEWDLSTLTWVFPAHLVGGTEALGWALHATPTTGMAAPALDWLAAAMFYLLAAAACISVILQLYLASPLSKDRKTRTTRSTMKEA